jgi:hypothetical protein
MASFNWPPLGGGGGGGITALTGDVTASGTGSVVASLTAVTNSTLTTLSALTSVGTLTTGIWNATPVGITYGGTGATTAAAAINALLPAQTGQSGNVLTTNGTAASWETLTAVDSFTIFQTPAGTYPTALSPTSTMTFTSVDNSITITGNSTTNTINFSAPDAAAITALTGDVTATGPGSVTSYLMATTNATLATLSALTTASALATVGTIGTGTWQGTVIAPTYNTSAPVALTESAGASTITWTSGNLFTLTLNANLTISFSGAISGQTIIVRLTNTSSNYTVTWPSMKWPNGSAPTQTIGAHTDVYTIFYDGTNYYGNAVQNF